MSEMKSIYKPVYNKLVIVNDDQVMVQIGH